MSRGGRGISIPSPNYPVLCFPLPYRVAPVFVQVVSPPLGWSPLSYFLDIWSQTGNTRGPSVVFEAVDMPYPGPFHFSYSVDYIYDFCPFPGPDVFLSIFVCDVEHTSFHFGLCFRKFVLCLFGQCPCLCTICHSTQELYTCLVRHVARYHSFHIYDVGLHRIWYMTNTSLNMDAAFVRTERKRNK